MRELSLATRSSGELSRSVLKSLHYVSVHSGKAFPAWLRSCFLFCLQEKVKASQYYWLLRTILFSTAAFYFAFIWL